MQENREYEARADRSYNKAAARAARASHIIHSYLGMLASARCSHVQDIFAHELEQWKRTIERVLLPPHMIDSVPASAPISPPDTGASIAFTPWAAATRRQ